MTHNHTPRVLIEGLDGSGKSSAALEAAALLSENYRSSRIKVVDSDGVSMFTDGQLDSRRMRRLDILEPKKHSSRVGKVVRLGAFSTARRMADSWLTGQADMVISVRDPFRIDPAAYLAIFAPGISDHYSPEDRLRFFDRMTVARHPDRILHLDTDLEAIVANLESMGATDPAETQENMTVMSAELPLVIGGYKRIFGSGITTVEALTPATTGEVASHTEPLLYAALARDAYAKGVRPTSF